MARIAKLEQGYLQGMLQLHANSWLRHHPVQLRLSSYSITTIMLWTASYNKLAPHLNAGQMQHGKAATGAAPHSLTGLDGGQADQAHRGIPAAAAQELIDTCHASSEHLLTGVVGIPGVYECVYVCVCACACIACACVHVFTLVCVMPILHDSQGHEGCKA